MSEEPNCGYCVLRHNERIVYNGIDLSKAHSIIPPNSERKKTNGNDAYNLLTINMVGGKIYLMHIRNLTLKDGEEQFESEGITQEFITMEHFEKLGNFSQSISGDIGAASRFWKANIADEVKT